MSIYTRIHSGIPIESQVGIHSRYGVNRGTLRGPGYHTAAYGVRWGSGGGLMGTHSGIHMENEIGIHSTYRVCKMTL